MGDGNASVKVASVKAELELNYEQFLQGIEEAKSVFNDFADEIDRPLALHFDEDNNFDVLSEKIDEIREELESLGNIDLSDINLDFNTDGIESVKDAINEIRDDIEELNNSSVDINTNTEGIEETDDTVERLKAIIESINDRNINIKVNSDGVINATAEMQDLSDSEEETEEQSRGLGETLGTAIYAFQAVFQATKEIAESSMEQFAQLQMSARVAGNIFGSFGNNIKAFASTSMTSLGMSSGATMHYADMLGFALKAQGDTSQSAGKMSEQLVDTADNMALASGGSETMQQAVQVLTAAIGGQTFGLKSLGINITGVNKKWTPLHQSMYIMHQVMEKVNKNFGSLSGNLNTTAGQMQIAKSTMEQFGERIGEVLAPQLAEVNKVLGHLYDDFEHLSPAMKKGVVIAGEVGVGLLGLTATIAVVSTAVDVMGEAFEGFTAILLTNPIVDIIMAIIAVVALLYESWKHNWLGMRNIIDNFINFMKRELNSLKPAFEEFKKLWIQIKPVVDEVLKFIGDALVLYIKMMIKEVKGVVIIVTEAIKIIAKVIKGIEDIIKELKKIVGDVIRYIENKVHYIENTFKEWQTTTGNVIKSIVNFFKSIPRDIGKFLDDAKNTVVRWGRDVGNFFTKTIPHWMNEIKAWFETLPAKIEFGLGYAVGTLVKWGVEMYDYLTSNIPKWIDDIGHWFEKLPGRIGEWLEASLYKTAHWDYEMLHEAEQIGSNFLNSIGSWFEQLPGRLWDWFINSFQRTQKWKAKMINEAEQAGSNFLKSIGNWFEQLPGKIGNYLWKVIGKVVRWGNNIIITGHKAMCNFANSVINAVKNLPSEMGKIGSNIIHGLWAGLESDWGGLMSWVHHAAHNIVAGFKSALDIHSPSRKMYREVGVWILPGISKAIEDGLPDLLNTITKQVGKMVGHMQKQIKTGVGGIKVPVPESLENFGDKIFNNKAVWQEPNLISQNQNNNIGGGYASSGTTNSEIHHNYEIHIHGNNNDPEAIAKEIKRQIQLAQHGF